MNDVVNASDHTPIQMSILLCIAASNKTESRSKSRQATASHTQSARLRWDHGNLVRNPSVSVSGLQPLMQDVDAYYNSIVESTLDHYNSKQFNWTKTSDCDKITGLEDNENLVQ